MRELASQRAFVGVSALLFAASAAVTIVWCASMSAMGEMPMPGGWTMSMAWMAAVALPAAGRHTGAAVSYRPTPARPGDTACASDSSAATAVPV